MTDDPFSVEIDVRFRDLDPMGHVNNAVFATYLEHARVAYYREVIGVSLVDVDTVIVHLEIDYEAPIELGDAVEVATWIPRLGESSLPMEYSVFADGERVATADSVQVIVDPETGRARSVPDDWREHVAAYEGW